MSAPDSTPASSAPSPAASGKVGRVLFAITDQGLAVGATFIANVALARAGTKADYGMFALLFTLFTFLAGLHNALILEPYSVYGAGKYRAALPAYRAMMLRRHFLTCAGLTVALLAATGAFLLAGRPDVAAPMLGLTVALGFMLTGAFLRRTFYIQLDSRRVAGLAAGFFVVTCAAVAALYATGRLTGLTTFLALALGWLLAGLPVLKRLAAERAEPFLTGHPGYWAEHWGYAKWILGTALVFQLVNQGYFWIVGALLSVEALAELRAAYNLIQPMVLVYASTTALVVPMMARGFDQHGYAGVAPTLRTAATVLVAAALAFVVLLWAAGGPLLHLLYAGKYDGALGLLKVLSVIPVMMGLGHAYNSALKAVRRPALIFRSYLGAGVATLLAGIPLTHYLGLTGAAWGMLLSASVYGTALASGFLLLRRSGGADRRPET